MDQKRARFQQNDTTQCDSNFRIFFRLYFEPNKRKNHACNQSCKNKVLHVILTGYHLTRLKTLYHSSKNLFFGTHLNLWVKRTKTQTFFFSGILMWITNSQLCSVLTLTDFSCIYCLNRKLSQKEHLPQLRSRKIIWQEKPSSHLGTV